MPEMNLRILVILLLIPWLQANAVDTTTEQARRIIDFCLANHDKCSLSIHHITGRWKRHLNPDRLNPLASSWKVVPLIAYGEAVADGKLDPNQLIPRDEWGRFYVGGDGGALENAWKRFGKPEQVTLDQMVSAMMRESDNATPDWLYNELGPRKLQQAINRYLLTGSGYHDIPKAISSMFLTWDDNPVKPLIGERIVRNYSDFGTNGYRGELDFWFARLLNPLFVDRVRAYRCTFLPWITPPPCSPPTVGTSEPKLVQLQEGFYMRSNTRTYTRLMQGLLQRKLLPRPVQNAIEHNLEWRLEMTGDRFRRYGAKSGTLGTIGGLTVVNWTTYVETKSNAPGSNRGVRAAVTLHLKGDGDYVPLEFAFIRPSLAEALVEDPAFAEEVRSRIPKEVPRPDLAARIHHVKTTVADGSHRLRIEIDIFNIGIKQTGGPSAVDFYLSQNRQLDGDDILLGRIPVRSLKPGRRDRKQLRFNLESTSPQSEFLITVVDPDNTVQESEEDGNIQWEKLRRLP